MEKDEKKKGAMLDEAFLQNLMQNEQVEQILEEGEAFQTLMAYYRCAIMEVETKFRVLNEQYSLEYDRNPIEDIKSRTKSMEDSNRRRASLKNFTAKRFRFLRK
jgi:putative GTP pyrophosphokinase